MHENKYISSLDKYNLDRIKNYLKADKNNKEVVRHASYILFGNEAPVTRAITKTLRKYGCSVFTHIDKGDFPYFELKVFIEKPRFWHTFKCDAAEEYLSILKEFLDDDEAKAINIFKGWVAEAMKEYIDEKRTAPK